MPLVLLLFELRMCKWGDSAADKGSALEEMRGERFWRELVRDGSSGCVSIVGVPNSYSWLWLPVVGLRFAEGEPECGDRAFSDARRCGRGGRGAIEAREGPAAVSWSPPEDALFAMDALDAAQGGSRDELADVGWPMSKSITEKPPGSAGDSGGLLSPGEPDMATVISWRSREGDDRG